MIKASLRRLASDEEGGQAVEYGLIMAVIAIGLIIALIAFRKKLAEWFGLMGDKVTDEGNSTSN